MWIRRNGANSINTDYVKEICFKPIAKGLASWGVVITDTNDREILLNLYQKDEEAQSAYRTIMTGLSLGKNVVDI